MPRKLLIIIIPIICLFGIGISVHFVATHYVKSNCRIVLELPSGFDLISPQCVSGLKTQDLFDALCKSPEWRVSPINGMWEATSRQSTLNARFDDSGSFYASGAVVYPIGALQTKWCPTNIVLHNRMITLTMKEEPEHNVLRSNLQMSLIDGIVFVVTEDSPTITRDLTKKILKSIADLLVNATSNMARRLQQDIPMRHVDKKVSISNIRIKNGDGVATVSSLSGLINPHEPGYVEFEVANPKTKDIVNKFKLFRTREYVGYSENEDERFYFSGELGFDDVGIGSNVVINIVFHPLDTNSNSCVVYTTNTIVKPWHR